MATQPQPDQQNPGATYDEDAQFWQSLSGAAFAENPYAPFLQPKVIDRGGKKVLRIPKNQELLKLADFFNTAQNTKFGNVNDFAKTYLGFLNDERRFGLDTAKFNLDVAKEGRTAANAGKPKDRKLTIAESQKLGVPIGTMLSQVEGQNVPTGNTTSYNNFVRDANLSAGGMSREPRIAYQDYLEAQQLITQHPEKFDQVRNDPRAAPFAHLLKPKSSNDLFDLFSTLLGGTTVDTNQ